MVATNAENRELIRKQKAHRLATMMPIRTKFAGISEQRKELRRRRKAPTAWDIMEQEQTVAAGAPTFTPPATAIPQASMAAPTADDVAYSPIGFQEPSAAPEDWQLEGMITPEMRTAPGAPSEDYEFDRQMEDEAAEAQALKQIEKKTGWNKHRSDYLSALYKVKVQLRKLAEEDQEAKARKAPATYEEHKAELRAPTGAEALGWTGEAPGLQDFIIAGGTPEELRGIRQEEADRITLEKYAPQYIAPSGPDVRTLQRRKAGEYLASPEAIPEEHRERLTEWAGEFETEFERNRELVRRQREHREATMAPIRAKLADISEQRKKLRREAKAPTGWDVMEHREKLAEIKAPLAKQWQPKIIENVETGEQRPYAPGELIPAGFKEAGTIARPKEPFGAAPWYLSPQWINTPQGNSALEKSLKTMNTEDKLKFWANIQRTVTDPVWGLRGESLNKALFDKATKEIEKLLEPEEIPDTDIDAAIKQAKINLGPNATPAAITSETERLLLGQ